jgi:hypothetical protein
MLLCLSLSLSLSDIVKIIVDGNPWLIAEFCPFHQKSIKIMLDISPLMRAELYPPLWAFGPTVWP